MPEAVARRKRLSWKALVSFFLALALCFLAVVFVIFNRLGIERLTMESIILEKSNRANETLSRLLYKTQTLAAFAQISDTTREFERIAATLIDDPSILNMLIAPGGVVSNVYPLAGNEAVVGLDFFSDGAGNKEAILAKETGALVLGGPFDAVQGGQIIVGRLPVYTDLPNGEKSFWGLVSVTLKYPDAMDAAGLDEVRIQGFDYEIWRVNPDDGRRQVIAGSDSSAAHDSAHHVEQKITIQNAEWFFRIYSTRPWYTFPDIWVLFFCGLGISVLISVVIQNNDDLKQLKEKFETLSHTDSLTGIDNRRHFMTRAQTQLERSQRLGSPSAVIMMDIDHFKGINDRLGHLVGDNVLRGIVQTIQGTLRPYDLFGRYGGEEFIILASDIAIDEAQNLAERMRSAIETARYVQENSPITASFGVAAIDSAAKLQETIARADEALYAAKRDGRNRVALYAKKDGGLPLSS